MWEVAPHGCETAKKLFAAFRRPRTTHVAAGVLFALAAAGVCAEVEAPPSTKWLCWQSHATILSCRLGDEEAAGAFAPTGDAEAEQKTDVPEARDRRHRLPPVVEAILRRPRALGGRIFVIPLLTEPQDMEFARELAASVMCGVKRHCEVDFLRSFVDIALAMDHAGDPALK